MAIRSNIKNSKLHLEIENTGGWIPETEKSGTGIKNVADRLATAYPGIQIVGEAETVADSISLIARFNPDLLFINILLSDGTGFDLLNKISNSGKIIFTD